MRRQPRKSGRNAGFLTTRRLDNLSATVSDLFEKAVQNEKILSRYQQFELKLLDADDFEALLDLLLNNSLEYFLLDCVELWLYDPQGTLQELMMDIEPFDGLSLLPLNKGMKDIYSRKPQVRLVSMAKESLPIFAGQSPHSVALLPLVRHGVLVGSLHLGAKESERFTLDKSTDFITHLASVVSVCLENAVNQERLLRLSMYDVLTQVKNRRAFQQALDKEVSRATRNSEPLSLLFVDLDHFKQINDTHGHPTGDRVLKVVAQFILGMLRKTDHVCRYGGEEFSLVLPNCCQARAMEIAERIRYQVSELHIENDEGLPVSVTLSIGITSWQPSGEIEQGMAERLVAYSDQGVYLSKAAGRNTTRYVEMV